jgi:NitT/TauT family transport system permease protein
MTLASRLVEVALPAGTLAGIIGLWELALWAWAVPAYLAPAPHAILGKIWRDRAILGGAVSTTLAEAATGYLLGNAIGVLLAIVFLYRPGWERLAMLPIVATNSVPVAAFAPAVIVWFGVGMTSKVVLVGFVTCFTALTNQLQGFRRCDQGAVDLLRSFGARERRIFWSLRFPAALPYLFTALRVGSVRSVIIAIVAEMLGAYRGVGWIIFETTSSMDYLRLWAAVLSASVAGIGFFGLVALVEHRVVWWHVSVGWRRAG